MAQDLPASIVELALRQHGNVTRQQLLDLGLGADAIAYRVRAARLHRVHLGVYAVGRPPNTPLERAAAALLACGPSAALSHGSAMTLWGFWKRWEAPFEVTVVRDRRRPGIRIHRSCTLTRWDLRSHFGIRVTSPARTLVDLAPRLTDKQLARAVNDALLSRCLTRTELNRAASQCRLLEPFAETNDAPTRSQFEDAFLNFCKRLGLPRPRINVRVAGREVDAFFEEQKLIVELDGYRFHGGRGAFERDRDQDADAMAEGIGTIRITWDRMNRAPGREAERLLTILRARRAA